MLNFLGGKKGESCEGLGSKCAKTPGCTTPEAGFLSCKGTQEGGSRDIGNACVNGDDCRSSKCGKIDGKKMCVADE